MAGSGIRGQFEEKFKALIRDIEEEVGSLFTFHLSDSWHVQLGRWYYLLY